MSRLSVRLFFFFLSRTYHLYGLVLCYMTDVVLFFFLLEGSMFTQRFLLFLYDDCDGFGDTRLTLLFSPSPDLPYYFYSPNLPYILAKYLPHSFCSA